ncbi:hypothetical protein L1987_11989 [Smallanthus sonchifolius]|uniref:Uncharacterized protein n=1 Tax=Smallanthus sonchifolius TaxID=185202 RepID=A0ACB9JEN0_9ASTR|nr:hypothetical protein L1987_11989 [Smallanthus sonchifolius]
MENSSTQGERRKLGKRVKKVGSSSLRSKRRGRAIVSQYARNSRIGPDSFGLRGTPRAWVFLARNHSVHVFDSRVFDCFDYDYVSEL